MGRITTNETTKVIGTSHELITQKKCLVTLQQGCVWTQLLDDGEPIGIAFGGPAEFAVDAIAETDRGAVGQSIAGTLKGIQIYFGTGKVDSVSEMSSGSDFQKLGYNNEQKFLEDVNAELEDLGAKKGERRGPVEDGDVLIGTDQEDDKIILVAKQEKTVLIKGESVFVVEDDKLVSVDESGVTVTESSGKTITVGKNGISGMDIPGIGGLGQTVSNLVGQSMMGLKGLKGLKSLKKLRSREVDDLDWNDEE